MQRNIVLICLDSVRKDYFDKYAPRLQKRADISYDQCRAASSWSVPSHASILTGELPNKHGVHSHNYYFDTINKQDTFLSKLEGYKTIGVSANGLFNSAFGADVHFDSFTSIDPINRFPNGLDLRKLENGPMRDLLPQFIRMTVKHEKPIQSVANATLAQVDQISRDLPIPNLLDSGANLVSNEATSQLKTTSEPVFLFLNYMDAHSPLSPFWDYDQNLYSAPYRWDSSEAINAWEINTADDISKYEKNITLYRELYAAAIDYLDRQVISLIDEISDLSSNETTFIITSDHGENLGFKEDDYLFSHVSSLSESLLHVPLLIINPPTKTYNLKSRFISQTAFNELIYQISCEEILDVSEDRIAAERVGIGSTTPDLAEVEYRYWDRMLRCVYDENQKYIWDSLGEIKKYTSTSDCQSYRLESVDDFSLPDWVNDFFNNNIREYKEEVNDPSNHDIDDGSYERLKQLGYVD